MDLPDRKLDLFLRLCKQSGDRLSQAKRDAHFAMLTDEELARLERAVRDGFKREIGDGSEFPTSDLGS